MSDTLKDPKALITIAIIIVAGLYIFNPFISEEDKILKVLGQLEKNYYLNKGENKIQFASRVSKLSQVFSKDATGKILIKYRGEQNINGRQEFKQSMVSAAGRLNEFSIRFFDTTVNVTGADAANVETSCEIQYQEDELYQAQAMLMEFEKVDGDWLIKSVKNSEEWEF